MIQLGMRHTRDAHMSAVKGAAVGRTLAASLGPELVQERIDTGAEIRILRNCNY